MEKNSNLKIITGALLVLSVIFLTSSVALFFMKQAEVEKRIALEKRVEELNKEKTRLSKELDDATLVKKDLEIKLGNVEEKAKLIEGQLSDEKRAKESAFSQLETEKRESKRLLEELMKVKDEKEKISLNLANIENESNTLKTQLSSIQQAKEILERKLKELLAKNEVELEKIVVKPEVAISPNPGSSPSSETSQKTGSSDIKGEVLVVNKKFDFVVVSLGEDDGLAPGMNLGIYRDAKLLAMLQVEKIHANMAAAKIPPEWKNVDIKEGDMVAVVK